MPKLALDLHSFKLRTPFLFLLYILLSGLLYFPALNCGFELDSHKKVENNFLLKHPDQWKDIFRKATFDNDSFGYRLNEYRPVTMLSLAANYQWLGPDPYFFRFINIVIHGINSFIVFLFVYLFWKRKDLGVVTGLLFCVLPVHEWTVNYIVGRADLLQLMLSLISLILLVVYLSEQKIWFYLLSLVGFLLALLSKETAIFFPLILTCITAFYMRLRFQKDDVNVRTMNQYLSKAQRRVPDDKTNPSVLTVTLPFYILAVVYFILCRAYFPEVNTIGDLLSLGDVGLWLQVCLQYHVRFIFPWSTFSSMAFLINNVWFCLIFLSALGVFLYQYFFQIRVRENILIFWLSLSWLLIGCVFFWPVRHDFVKQGYYLSEHFLYFGSVGFAILLACFILTLSGKKKVVLLVLISLFYGITTWVSSTYWTTEEEILRRVFKKEKSKEGMAYRQLLYRFDQDIPALKELIVLSRNDLERSLWSKQLGETYCDQNRTEDGIKILNQSLAYNSKNFEAMLELSKCYLNNNQWIEGKTWLEKIIQQDAKNLEAYRILGEAYYQHNQYSSAIKNMEKTLFLDPDYENIWKFLAVAYYFNGDKDKYLQMRQRIESSSTDLKEAMKFFIKEFDRLGHPEAVMDWVQQNQKLFNKDAEMLNVLATALFNSGKKERGRKLWKYILSFEPSNVDALRGLTKP